MKKAYFILFLMLSLSSYSQISQMDAEKYSKQAEELVRNYFSQLDLLFGDKIEYDQKDAFIYNIKSNFFENEKVIVCNDIDISSSSEKNLDISRYLENVKLFHDKPDESYLIDSLFTSQIFIAKDFYFIKAEFVRKINVVIGSQLKSNCSKVDVFVKFIAGKSDCKIYSIKWHEENLRQFKEANIITAKEKVSNTNFSITTNNSTSITQTSAVCSGTVSSSITNEKISRGIAYSTNKNPSLSDNAKGAGNGIGQFSVELTGLSPNTIYYIRAYATSQTNTVYGEQREFKTFKNDGVSIKINQIYEYANSCKIDEARSLFLKINNELSSADKANIISTAIDNAENKCLLKEANETFRQGYFELASQKYSLLYSKSSDPLVKKKLEQCKYMIYNGKIDEAKNSKGILKDQKFKEAYAYKEDNPSIIDYAPELYFLNSSIDKAKTEFVLGKKDLRKKDYKSAQNQFDESYLISRKFSESEYYYSLSSCPQKKNFTNELTYYLNRRDKIEAKINKIEKKNGESICDFYKYRYLKNKYGRMSFKLGVTYNFSPNLMNLYFFDQQYWFNYTSDFIEDLSFSDLSFNLMYGRFGIFAGNINSIENYDLGIYVKTLGSIYTKFGLSRNIENSSFFQNYKQNYIAGISFIFPWFQSEITYRKNTESLNLGIGLNINWYIDRGKYLENKSKFRAARKKVRAYQNANTNWDDYY